MTKTEKFKDIIRSKYEEREIPFDKENWESIQMMMIASRREKNPYVRPESFLESLINFFSIQIKLYQAGLSTILIVGCIFYFSRVETGRSKNSKIDEYPLIEDSLKNLDIQDNLSLAKNFSLRIN